MSAVNKIADFDNGDIMFIICMLFLITLSNLIYKGGTMKKSSKRSICVKEKMNVLVHEINYDKLAELIVCATEKLEEKKNKKNEEENNAHQIEWNRILKQKIYPKNEKWMKRKLHQFRNELMAYIELVFFKEKNTKDTIATFALIKLATEMMFVCIKWSLYILCMKFIYNFCVNSADNLILLVFAFIAWTIARLVRIAVFEVKKMEDANLILAIFSGSISFVALIVAIVAIIISN